MGNPEGGHGERKDKEYFFQELEKLAAEAKANGQGEAAVVLYSLLGAMKLDKTITYQLAKACSDFSQQILDHVDKLQQKKGPTN